ncbi:FCPF [Symbiodinium natans]|uniref:FCPF protein n=1 Tax=Symbiodinium natans TaxID=878477 RepID=A0A812UU58_9DINO|nr:FCPF [Symbiodinium natans]
MAFCEVSQDQSAGTPAAAGDFGFKVLTSSDPAEKTKKLSAELANGRLAMMAIIGMFFQDTITGKFPGFLSPSAGLKFADVPNGLAAISKVPAAGWGQILAYMAFCEVSQDQSAGTPAAAGDFGFKVLTSSDPAEKTKKLSAELANGRLAMMAIIGMFFQDTITGKFPGFLSPSAGLKFADVPNGLAAISKVPAAGWGQILAYMAFCEVSQDQSAGTPAAAGDFGFKVLTSSDPAEKTKKLSAELANGRLAMMAIIGMFFQDT